jgi:phenylpropionate dioxygenase-like ring-hydroxylating dioxygenase large terminal subunit
VPSLDEYLGGAGWMLDLIVGLHPDGMCVAGPPDRYTVRGDWKTAAENFSGDVYHAPNLHKSGKAVRMAYGIGAAANLGRTYELATGTTSSATRGPRCSGRRGSSAGRAPHHH